MRAAAGSLFRRVPGVTLALVLIASWLVEGPVAIVADVRANTSKVAEAKCARLVNEALAALASLPHPTTAEAVNAAQQKLQTAKLACESERELLAAKATLLGDMRNLLSKEQVIAACTLKIKRVSQLLDKGIKSMPEALFRNQLRVWRAIYGDLDNELKAHSAAQGMKDGGFGGSPRYDDRSYNQQTARFGHVHDADGKRRFGENEPSGDNRVPTEMPKTLYHTCDATWFFVNQCHGDRSAVDNSKSLPPPKNGATNVPDSTYCIVVRGSTVSNTDLCGFDPSPEGVKSIGVEYGCADEAGGWDRRTTVVTADSTKIHLICQYPEPSNVTRLQPVRSFEDYLLSEPCSIDRAKLDRIEACRAKQEATWTDQEKKDCGALKKEGLLP